MQIYVYFNASSIPFFSNRTTKYTMFLRLLFKIIYHSSPHDQVNTMQLIVAVTLLIIIFSHATLLLMCYHILNLYFLSIFCHNQLKSLTCIEHEDYCNNLARLNDKIYDFLETISRINICSVVLYYI